jgi:hypothetical protein
MRKTISYIGETKISKNNKEHKEVKFVGDDNVYAAYGFSFTNIQRFKVGDEIDVEIDASGRYINKVTKVPGGPAQPSQSTSTPPSKAKEDRERDTGIYTRYALDYLMANPKATPQSAVDVVMSIRLLVTQALQAKRDDGKEAKLAAAEKMAEQLGIDTNTPIWDTFRGRYKNVDVLVSDLESLLAKKSTIAFTPEGEMTIVANK